MTNVLLEKKGNIAVATINRPKALNALNSAVVADLDADARTDRWTDERDPCAGRHAAAGEKAFVAGADIARDEGR